MVNNIFFNTVLFAVLFLTACTGEPPLTGVIDIDTESDWKPVIYLIDPGSFTGIATSYSGKVIDSAAIKKDGSFRFEKMPDAPTGMLIEIAVQKRGERYQTMLDNDDPTTSNYFPVVWQNGQTIEVTASADQFQNSFSIQDPSPQNTAMLRLRDIRQHAFDRFLTGGMQDAHDESLIIEQEKTLLNYQQSLMDFADETPYLLPALVATRWTSIPADYERIPEFLYGQCVKWESSEPANPYAGQLCDLANRDRLPVMTGDQIPNYPLPMSTGDTTDLIDLLGPRLTILDLWASWCAPCRKENRQYLVPLWEKYHETGLEIIGYALETRPNTWNAAIEKDGVGRWPQASHLNGDESPLFEALRISTIPANFIIDSNGKVIAKNLHGEDLIAFVDAYLAESRVL